MSDDEEERRRRNAELRALGLDAHQILEKLYRHHGGLGCMVSYATVREINRVLHEAYDEAARQASNSHPRPD